MKRHHITTITSALALVLVAVACDPAPPRSQPDVVRITQPSGHEVRITVLPSSTAGIWAYRFTLTPPDGSPQPPLSFDVPTNTITIDIAKTLPHDGTPYTVTAQSLKDNKESGPTGPATFKVSTIDIYHPGIAGTPPTPGATATQIAAAEELIRQEIVAAFNNERLARGMTPLIRNGPLETFETTVTDRNAAAGTCTTPPLIPGQPYTCHSGAAEDDAYFATCGYVSACNIGEDSNEGPVWFPVNSVVGWMKSPGHRYPILNPINSRVGVGVSCDSNGGAWLLAGFGDLYSDVAGPSPIPATTVEPPLIVTPEWGRNQPAEGPYPHTMCPSTTGTPGTPGTAAWTETVVNVG